MPSPEELEVLTLALWVGVWVVLLSLIPGVGVAWWLSRKPGPWKSALQALVLLPLVLPPVVTGYGLLLLFGRTSFLGKTWHAWTGGHLAYTTSAAVLAAAVVGFPLLVESIRLSMAATDRRLEQVSRSLGWGRWQTFCRVTLPLCAPGILAGAILTFARALGEFGATIILAGNIEGETRQIPLAVFTLMNQPGQETAVLRLCAISVILALLSMFAAAWLRRKWERKAGVA